MAKRNIRFKARQTDQDWYYYAIFQQDWFQGWTIYQRRNDWEYELI